MYGTDTLKRLLAPLLIWAGLMSRAAAEGFGRLEDKPCRHVRHGISYNTMKSNRKRRNRRRNEIASHSRRLRRIYG